MLDFQACAQAYFVADHKPNDPQVRLAYRALIAETLAQFANLPVAVSLSESDPYLSFADMREQVARTGTLRVWSEDFLPADHPLAQRWGSWSVNGMLRACHDYWGHLVSNADFSLHGEETAFVNHAPQFSGLAQRALATELRGQTCALHYGPGGFAPQKACLLPEQFAQVIG